MYSVFTHIWAICPQVINIKSGSWCIYTNLSQVYVFSCANLYIKCVIKKIYIHCNQLLFNQNQPGRLRRRLTAVPQSCHILVCAVKCSSAAAYNQMCLIQPFLCETCYKPTLVGDSESFCGFDEIASLVADSPETPFPLKALVHVSAHREHGLTVVETLYYWWIWLNKSSLTLLPHTHILLQYHTNPWCPSLCAMLTPKYLLYVHNLDKYLCTIRHISFAKAKSSNIEM